MPSFLSFRRKPLDLVASELADLQQRSEMAAAEAEAAAKRSHGPIASGSWLTPTDTVYDFLDLPSVSHRDLIASGGWCAPSNDELMGRLPTVSVKRGGITYPSRSYSSFKTESSWI